MNLADLILGQQPTPVEMPRSLAMLLGLAPPYPVPNPGKRYCKEDDEEEIAEIPKTITEMRREERELRRTEIELYLTMNGPCDTNQVADGLGVKPKAAYDDLSVLREGKRVVSIRRDGKMMWRVK